MLNGHTLLNTAITSDYDRCFTSGQPGAATAFSVFSTCPSVPSHILDKRKGLFEYYRPIEVDEHMEKSIWEQHMNDWHHKAIGVFQDHLNQEMMEDIIAHAISVTKIRSGFADFLKNLGELDIPITIFSAGVSNIIQGVLEYHDIPYTGIYGNELHFDKDGKCTGLKNEGVFIGRKTWASIPREIQDASRGRTHEILLGDSLGDILMSDPEKTTTSIGFLLSEHLGQREMYERTFHHVIESDDDDHGVFQKIIEQLKKGA